MSNLVWLPWGSLPFFLKPLGPRGASVNTCVFTCRHAYFCPLPASLLCRLHSYFQEGSPGHLQGLGLCCPELLLVLALYLSTQIRSRFSPFWKGCCSRRPGLITRLEQWDEPWVDDWDRSEFPDGQKSFCPGKRDELFPLSDSARVGAPLLPLTKL